MSTAGKDVLRCELSAKRILPAVRRELVRALVGRGMKQNRVAEVLGITPAAVTQYLKGKRGRVELTEDEIGLIKEILSPLKEGEHLDDEKVCEICRKIQERVFN